MQATKTRRIATGVCWLTAQLLGMTAAVSSRKTRKSTEAAARSTVSIVECGRHKRGSCWQVSSVPKMCVSNFSHSL